MKSRLSAAVMGSALLLAGGARAHARLISADPGANATVTAPAKLILHFSERLEPKYSGLSVMKADGAAVAVTTTVSKTDRTLMQGAPANPLAPGGYMVMWHAVSADGHKTQGEFNFTAR
jgi:methionine-rich copper-binding protein CopC